MGASPPTDSGSGTGQENGATGAQVEQHRAVCAAVSSGNGGDHGWRRTSARPSDDDIQRLNYSGKKKRHTRKHLAIVTPTKRVLVLTPAREGKVHDKRLLDETQLVDAIPPEVSIAVDLGFQGIQAQHDNIRIGHKKPKKQELTDQQKQENRELNRERVRCEHAFAGMKRYNAVSQCYRNHVPDFDDRLMLTAAGLWNFYLSAA